MELSIRLKTIVNMMEKCDSIVDVGTDHGYVPIYLVRNGLINNAIASDINSGPVEKAKKNVRECMLSPEITCRRGNGLSTVKEGEVQVAIIAGMGGNLIRDILEADLLVVKKLEYVILQPVQNAEVLREYLYNTGYDIICEDICFDDGKFYEIIKAKYNTVPLVLDRMYYEISKTLLDERHPVMQQFIAFKLKKYLKVYNTLNENTKTVQNRKEQLYPVIKRLKEFLE